MLKNKYFFQEHFVYDFEEVLRYYIEGVSGGDIYNIEVDNINDLLTEIEVLPPNLLANPSSLSFVEMNESNEYTSTGTSAVFFSKLYWRYKHHYCIDILNENEKIEAFGHLLEKVVNLLDYTYPKYSKLLEIYESNKSKLLDKLERVREGERDTTQHSDTSNNGTYKDLHNDTPQSTDVVATLEQDQYVSDLSKGSNSNSGVSHQTGNDTFEETESYDPTTIIERLNEIEKKFSQVWRKWLDEFEEIFIEEVNF